MFLFAPTVPSEPSPKNTARWVSFGSMSSVGSKGRLVWETSSLIPIVKRRLGCSRANSSNTPATIPGVNSFEDRPYRPPITVGSTSRSPAPWASVNAARTSRNNGSPSEPGSFVRSRTATRCTVGGSERASSRAGNGPVQPDLGDADALTLRLRGRRPSHAPSHRPTPSRPAPAPPLDGRCSRRVRNGAPSARPNGPSFPAPPRGRGHRRD